MVGQAVPHDRICISDGKQFLTPDHRHYLEKVLRLSVGDSFTIVDGKGREALARLGRGGTFEIGLWSDPGREPRLNVVLHPALLKGDRFEWLIEKAVELGVTKIKPLMTKRCVAGLPSVGKLDRWRKLVEEAMLQCGGCRLADISAPCEPRKLSSPGKDVQAFLLHEQLGDVSLSSFPRIFRPEVWLASGPEGGFTPEEVSAFSLAGWQQVWLGPRRFRADTAPLVAISRLLGQ